MFILGTIIYSFSTLYSGFLTASIVLIDLPSFHHHFDSKYASAVWSWWCSSEIFQVEFFYFSSIDIGFTGFNYGFVPATSRSLVSNLRHLTTELPPSKVSKFKINIHTVSRFSYSNYNQLSITWSIREYKESLLYLDCSSVWRL